MNKDIMENKDMMENKDTEDAEPIILYIGNTPIIIDDVNGDTIDFGNAMLLSNPDNITKDEQVTNKKYVDDEINKAI